MIDLKCCTVLVNNKAEYIALIKEAQKQGFTWANGYALTNIFCSFPTRLRFNGECKVYYNSSVYFYEHNYQCRDILNTLGRLILKRKSATVRIWPSLMAASSTKDASPKSWALKAWIAQAKTVSPQERSYLQRVLIPQSTLHMSAQKARFSWSGKQKQEGSRLPAKQHLIIWWWPTNCCFLTMQTSAWIHHSESRTSAVTSKVGLNRHLGTFLMCRHLGAVPNCRQKRNVPNCRLPELSPLHQNGAD